MYIEALYILITSRIV